MLDVFAWQSDPAFIVWINETFNITLGGEIPVFSASPSALLAAGSCRRHNPGRFEHADVPAAV